MKRYTKKSECAVIAVQLNLDTEGFVYQKWGGEQQCKPKDWVISNNGEVYTIDQKVFRKTYKELSPGVYVKTTPVWAEVAQKPGTVPTKEGRSHYDAGDYLVYNNEDGSDGYCMSADRFESMYKVDE